MIGDTSHIREAAYPLYVFANFLAKKNALDVHLDVYLILGKKTSAA